MSSSQRPDLGIFSRTFHRPALGAVLDAVAEDGFDLLHFSWRSAGLEALPADLTPERCSEVRRAVESRGLRLAGVSATFNVIHPDRARRQRETALACQVIGLAPALGTTFVSLSTGTRDPDDMWRAHPANAEPSAWSDLRYTLAVLLETAREAGVTLGIEPEHHNVVSSAHRARRLLDEFQDDHLRIILDAANLLTPATASQQQRILSEAFDLLGSDIAVIHAKDLAPTGDVAAGRGLLDYGVYFDLVVRRGIEAPVIIHEVEEDDVSRAREFVLDRLAAATVRSGAREAGSA